MTEKDRKRESEDLKTRKKKRTGGYPITYQISL